MREISELLKSERQKQGLSLKELSGRSGVSQSVLQAIEEGNLEWIGTPFLVRGFIRSYCTTLGMDAAPILDQFAPEIAACDQQDKGIQRYKAFSEAYNQKKHRRGLLWLLLLGILAAVAIYGAVWLTERRARMSAMQSEGHAGDQLEIPKELSEHLARSSARPAPGGSGVPGGAPRSVSVGDGDEPGTPGGSEPSSDASAPRSVVMVPQVREDDQDAGDKSEAHRLSIVAGKKTWVQVAVDDHSPRSLMLQPGDRKDWEAAEKAKIVFGHTDQVVVTWDGQPVNLPVKSGRMRIRLPDPALIMEAGKLN